MEWFEHHKNSPYKLAAEKAGFKFFDERMTYDESFQENFMQGKFECICNRTECYSIRVPIEEISKVDPYEKLYKLGSFSKQHLLDDGYSVEEATRISDTIEEELKNEKANECAKESET